MIVSFQMKTKAFTFAHFHHLFVCFLKINLLLLTMWVQSIDTDTAAKQGA